MGKTHEAMIRAEKEYQKKAIVKTTDPQTAVVSYRHQRNLRQDTSRWYEELKSRLEIQFSNKALKTILFTGPSHQAGVSMTSHGYADYLASAHRYKVLFIQIIQERSQPSKIADIHQFIEFSNILPSYSQMVGNRSQNSNGNLFAVTCTREMLQSNNYFQTIQFDEVIQSMRERFDYVILDAPPVTLFSETRKICKNFDGVILVLEFGKTRQQVAQKVKQELKAAGANFLGVVINKRKYFIPKWIYKRL